MDATDRFLAYATVQAAFVGVVAGLAGGLTMVAPLGWSHTYLAAEASGPVAGLTHRYVGVFWVVAALLFVLAPLAAAGYAVLTDRKLGGAGTPYAVGALLPVFLVGVVAGSSLAAPAGALVEQHSESAPQVSFAADYAERDDGRGVLTFTHDGGDVVRVGRLYVESDDITTAPRADQTEFVPWQGEATAEWDGDAAVGPGDSVAVGVEGDCVVRVVYRTEWSSATLAKHTCPGATPE